MHSSIKMAQTAVEAVKQGWGRGARGDGGGGNAKHDLLAVTRLALLCIEMNKSMTFVLRTDFKAQGCDPG